jgi:hypothetical protein
MTKLSSVARVITHDTATFLTQIGDSIIRALLLPAKPLITRAEQLEIIDRKDDYFTRSEAGFTDWLSKNSKNYYHHSGTQPRVSGKFAKQS